MKTKYKKKMIILFSICLALFFINFLTLRENPNSPIVSILGTISMISFLWGCYCWAKGKGYSGFLGTLLGFTIFGLFILAFLSDKHKYDVEISYKETEITKGGQFAKRFIKQLYETKYYKVLLLKPRFTDDETITPLISSLGFHSLADMSEAKFILFSLLFPNQDVRESAQKAFIEICSREFAKLGKQKFLKQLKDAIDSIDEIPAESLTDEVKQTLNGVYNKTKGSV